MNRRLLDGVLYVAFTILGTPAMVNHLGLIDAYRRHLPIDDSVKPVSLNEGHTPLIELTNLSQSLGGKVRILAKFEGLNPTGSFKDRGMTLAVTMAKHQGIKGVICASTGNTSAAAAAYAARAQLACFVIIPEGKIAFGKLSQALIFGARVLQIRGNFDQGMELVKELSNTLPVALVNSVNPYRLQGQKTVSFEVFDQLGGTVPDYHAVPVGNAANISAHWMGYNEMTGTVCYFPDAIRDIYQQYPVVLEHKTAQLPVMLGFQAEGAASMVHNTRIEHPETLATAIRIGNPQSRMYARQAVEHSGGWFAAYSDETILETQRMLAGLDGVFCEPASAVSVAGVIAAIQDGRIAAGSTVVCTLTGNGIKDPDIVVKQFAQGECITTIDPEYDQLQEHMSHIMQL